jgi:hypothetical protein
VDRDARTQLPPAARAAGIGLIYLATMNCFNGMSLLEAENAYKKIYPEYNPARGMHEYIRINWDIYRK